LYAIKIYSWANAVKSMQHSKTAIPIFFITQIFSFLNGHANSAFIFYPLHTLVILLLLFLLLSFPVSYPHE
jgi:hypothetical protein